MWKRTLLVTAAALVALGVAAGCSNSRDDHPAAHSTSASSASATAAPTAEAHNNADVWFVRHMIPHHEQAIQMCDIVLAKQGIDPRVRGLATQIKAEQGPEIQQLQEWLNQWGNPPMPSMPSGTSDMPGMVSDEEVTVLKNAEGVDASRFLLTQMTAHHEGAIATAQTEVEDGADRRR